MIAVDRCSFVNHQRLLVPCGHAAQDLVELEHIQGGHHSRVFYLSLLKVQVWLEQLGIPPNTDHETLDHQLGTAKKTIVLGAR